MVRLKIQRRWWHPIIQKLAASRFGSWLLAANLQRLDKPLLRLTNNRTSFTSLLAGLPVVLLHTTGAKTGLPRHTPLVAIPDGGRIILIGTGAFFVLIKNALRRTPALPNGEAPPAETAE